jgi:hypothetical protein
MKLTDKQSYYLSLIQSAEQNKLSLREVAEQNSVSPMRLYAAVKTLRDKGALPAAKSKSGTDFVKLSLPPPVHEARIELETQLTNGQPLWFNISEDQLPAVLRALSA